MGDYRKRAQVLYAERGYTNDPVTLALRVCEEAGELAKAINVYHNPKYVPSDHCRTDTPEHEIEDLLIYLGALVNSLKLPLDF